MVARLRILVSSLLVAPFGGCSGGSQNPKCIPGLTVDCPCRTGQQGSQTCTSEGTFAACVCTAPATDAGWAGDAAATRPPDAAAVGDSGDSAGVDGPVVDATADQSADVPAVADAAPPGNDAPADANLAADAPPDVPSGVADTGMGDAVYVPNRCGDGIVVPPEQCDDGNTVAGDGCSPTCKVEIGYKCSGSPSVCTPTVCGDGKTEGAERCDDGNTMPFDGCSEDCQIEPDCSGGSCTSKCGDGIVVPPEQCDDGNTIDGDGCSKDCQIEPGWTCTQPTLGDKMMVPVTYRDFRFHNPSDFEPGVTGQNVATIGAVNPALDKDGKPVFSGLTTAHIESVSTFAEWYRNTAGVNHPTASKMALWSNGQGGYVNRYGANGEQWNVTQIAYSCGTVGQEKRDANGKAIPCTSLTSGTDCEKMEAQGYTQLKCYTDTTGTTYQALYVVAKVDGNPLFFPIDADPFSADQLEAAAVPSIPLGLYDASGTWPFDVDAAGNKRLHNFSFTSEARYWFLYDKTTTYTLDFASDEDMWVFINNRLAVDLGGIHTPVVGSITLDATTASGLSLVDGRVYEVAVFHAERQTTCSAYEMTLIGFNTAPSECTPCGNASTAGDGGCSNAMDSPADGAGPL